MRDVHDDQQRLHLLLEAAVPVYGSLPWCRRAFSGLSARFLLSVLVRRVVLLGVGARPGDAE
ncbi:MAG: hypothetical protein OXG04_19465 [Acidobacteria bacterium]|nr:hypothetical protein [Acidobacteriota bacterium]